MRCYYFILALSTIFLFSCRKAIQNPQITGTVTKELPEAGQNYDEEFICEFPFEPQIDLDEWRKYLIENIQLDSAFVKDIPHGVYTAKIRFKIEMDGSLSNILIIEDPGFGFGSKALMAIRNYKMKWLAARFSGLPFSSYRVQPIKFVIED